MFQSTFFDLGYVTKRQKTKLLFYCRDQYRYHVFHLKRNFASWNLGIKPHLDFNKLLRNTSDLLSIA